jgi:tetratricopeptide (TPR) repeat protein
VTKESHAKHQSAQITQTWMLQGLKLFKVRYYRAAAQCFQNIGDQNLVKRCKAYELADQAAVTKGQHDQRLALALDKRNHLGKQERQQLKQEAKTALSEFREQMRQAGQLFNEIDLNQHAAQCFFSAGYVGEAADMFVKQNKFGPAAECFFKQGQVKRAAALYEQAGLFANAFECYERLEEWDSLLLCLYKHKARFGAKELESLLEKYLPVALNSCYQMYNLMSVEGQEGLSEENRGKLL